MFDFNIKEIKYSRNVLCAFSEVIFNDDIKSWWQLVLFAGQWKYGWFPYSPLSEEII
jgi:hypothetical protein